MHIALHKATITYVHILSDAVLHCRSVIRRYMLYDNDGVVRP